MNSRKLRFVSVGVLRAAPLQWRISASLLLLLLFVAAPLAAQTPDPYAVLPQTQVLQGFPDLGYPSALVNVSIYAAFDDPASGQFWQQSFPQLLPRVQNGEIRLVFVPLFGVGSITGGRSAARAAVCANEQGQFWEYADQLFAWQSQYGGDAFSSERLTSGADALGLNQAQWSSCYASSGSDTILNDAAREANNQTTFAATPFILVNDLPSLSDADSLKFTIDLELQRANAALAADLDAQAATPEATADVDRYVYDPLAHDPIPPPVALDLPDGWNFAYDALVLQDIDGIRPIPFAVYQGPITGGTGYIVLLWGFPNLVKLTSLTDVNLEPDIWTDATRLLRLAIVEEGCNVGTDLRRNYSVGGLQAIGTQFAAVDCPELPDTRGWFAGIRQFNANFVFYVYADPITAMDDDRAVQDLQSILDTAQFTMPEITPEPAG